jgi:hypothetical protein
MATTLTRIRVLATAATIGLFGAASAPAFSGDGFMAIHMDNQNANSAVAAYWDIQNTSGTVQSFVPAASEDGFMAIHMDNQKINSAVTRYWSTISTASR